MANLVSGQPGNLDIKIQPLSAYPIIHSLHNGGVLPETFRVIKGILPAWTYVAGTYPVLDPKTVVLSALGVVTAGDPLILGPSDCIIAVAMQAGAALTAPGGTTLNFALSNATTTQAGVTLGNVTAANLILGGAVGAACPVVGANGYITMLVGVNGLATNTGSITLFFILAQ